MQATDGLEEAGGLSTTEFTEGRVWAEYWEQALAGNCDDPWEGWDSSAPTV